MRVLRLHICLLLVAFLGTVGCASRLRPNPLQGWKGLGSAFVIGSPFATPVAEDYQDYIVKLPKDERQAVHPHDIQFFEGGSAQRAVEISIPLRGTWWKHVLIYDRDGKRTKTIKYASSRYMS
jgi:hypothetical protein